MRTPRRAAAVSLGVFLAVVAVVVGATAATGWRPHPEQRPAAARTADVRQAPDPFASDKSAPGSTASEIPDTSVAAQDEALHSRAGRVVARGHQFRIEKVALTSPVTVTVRGASITTDVVYRIAITAGPYPMRDMPAVVSIDNRPLAVGMESADLASLMAFTFDSSILTQGASLEVSYGLPSKTATVWTSSIGVVK